jgi:hypothetical protein
MKKDLGKFILVLFMIFSLDAQESKYYSYELTSSKKTAVINEPLNITFKARQKTNDEEMFFDFLPIKSKDYEIVSITDKRYEFNYHDAQKEFSYLLFGKIAKKTEVKFHFTIRIASDDGVAQAYTGGRDNVKSIPTTDIDMGEISIFIDIKPLEKKVDAVGKFTLNMKIDKHKLKPYDTLNIVYKLKGIGYLDAEFEPLKNINGVHIFKETNNKVKITNKGYSYNKEWNYALIGNSKYEIPKTILHTFDPKNSIYKDIKLQKIKVDIIQPDIKNLLDSKEYPNTKVNLTKYIDYLYSLIIFIAGFLASKLLKYIPKKPKEVDAENLKNIKKAKTEKELLKILMNYKDDINLYDEIDELEQLIYAKSISKDIDKIKKSIIKKLS